MSRTVQNVLSVQGINYGPAEDDSQFSGPLGALIRRTMREINRADTAIVEAVDGLHKALEQVRVEVQVGGHITGTGHADNTKLSLWITKREQSIEELDRLLQVNKEVLMLGKPR